MLSRLIITFLCAAAIGSVSGAFLTFDPAPVVLKDADISTSVSVRLNSKPTEEVTVYFENPSIFMSTCMIVFNSNNWNVPHPISVMSVPPLLESPDPRKQPESNSELRAKAVTVGTLPADLSSTNVLKITQASKDLFYCSIGDNILTTYNGLAVSFSKPGWYQMVSTGDLEVQILWGECGEKRPCFTAIIFRYGPTVMSLDTRGPVKGVGEYSMTQVTQTTNALQYTSGLKPGLHRTTFPCGSRLNIEVANKNGIVALFVNLFLVGGYTSPRGFCNKPRPVSPDNGLISSDGKSYSLANAQETDAFIDSWGIKDADVLTNPDARRSIPPLQQPGTICKFPEKPQPKPVVPVPTTATTTAATTTAATTIAATTTGTTTVTTTGTTTSTTATAPYSASTSPSTTSSTSTIYPLPPAPSGCNAIVPAESYIQSCILDAQASGSYVLSDKVKQTYLDKCHTLTDDMILDPTKEVINQGTKIRKEYGFGNVTCINSCSGKGTCTNFGCACSPGFSGVDCSMDLTKANQYDQSVNKYRINVNITVVQEQTEQHSKLPGSVPYATSAPSVPSVPSVHSTPSVDQSLASFVGSLPKPSTVSPHIAEKSQSPSPDSYDDFQKPILSSSISLGSLHMVSAAAVVITSVTSYLSYPVHVLANTTSQTKRQSSNDTRFALMETLRTCGDSASLQKYVTRQLLDTSGFFKDPSFDQSRAHGTRYLMFTRMDALWTARKAIQIGILVDTHPFSVDHCILCNQQLLSTSIAHLVVECEQVTGHRIQSGLVPAIQKSRLRLLGRSTRSRCGECIYLAPRWSLKW
ncbi:hypothetical protein BASA50_005531 [Batrachochytrium salamandrivorans]|uniref:EGF-like domain-containing protein n=1 Tax=Batrachochytrium salamandrivorans TaxID=1357716 RepID=A0ABQ8FCM6_9FUNG|nr:hypothetical protein BASA50_005531 [Batrachochytrium salamandrivorans]